MTHTTASPLSLWFLGRSCRTAGLLLTAVLLSGCADERQRVADWISPPTAAEMLGRMEQQVASGQVPEAIRMGEAFVAGPSPANKAEIHRMLARLLIEQGDAVGSLRHLQAVDAGASAVVVVPSAGAAQPLAADTPQPAPAVEAPAAKNSPPPSRPTPDVSASAGDASASVSGGKVEARAGNVSARVLP